MDCLIARESLNKVRDGTADPVEAGLLRMHLAECGVCRSTLDVDAAVELLPALDESIDPSANLSARFHERLIRHQAERADFDLRPRLWSQVAFDWITPQRLSLATLSLCLIIGIVVAGIYFHQGDEGAIVPVEQAIAEDLSMLEDLEVISNLDLLEDFDDISNLRTEPASDH